jgi:hypothetical protein
MVLRLSSIKIKGRTDVGSLGPSRCHIRESSFSATFGSAASLESGNSPFGDSVPKSLTASW